MTKGVLDSVRHFDPHIKGLEALLLQSGVRDGLTPQGFRYYPEGGLNMVMYGPAGAGKTNVALHMAVAAAATGYQVIYLTKDTPGRVLFDRIKEFNYYGMKEFQGVEFTEHRPWSRMARKPGVRLPQVVFLNELAEAPDEGVEDALLSRREATPIEEFFPNFFAFVDFDEIPLNIGKLDRYGATRSVYDALGYLQPAAKLVFQELRDLGPSFKLKGSNHEFRLWLAENANVRNILSDPEEWPGRGQMLLEDARTDFSDMERFERLINSRVYPEHWLDAILEVLSSGIQTKHAKLKEEVANLLRKNSGEQGIRKLDLLALASRHGLANDRITRRDLLVVCDSLSPAILEENLRLQENYSRPEADLYMQPKPLFLFVMESEAMPAAMSVSFPPDVQICLGTRREPHHDIQTRTIKLVKTRFQKSLHESAPFVISQGDSNPDNYSIKEYHWNAGNRLLVSGNVGSSLEPVFRRNAGVEIFPPLSHEAANIKPQEFPNAGPKGPEIKFGIPPLDDFTTDESLLGGGCSLLITKNRCGATPLSLHYLLGEIQKDAAYSVLYISFMDELMEIVRIIRSYPVLSQTLIPSTHEEAWSKLESMNEKPPHRSQHHLYKLPLLDVKDGPVVNSLRRSMYMFVPDFSWITPEEAMLRVIRLLKCDSTGANGTKPAGPLPGEGNYYGIRRIVLDRVGRLKACWPLVKNSDVFISSLVAMCNKYHIELMLIDDTVVEDESTGVMQAPWLGMAQNVIQLRRIPFHGGETVAVELLSAAGRIMKVQRPWELLTTAGAHKNEAILEVVDSFRGYAVTKSGEPVRCKIKLELSFDEENTPLCREVMAMKRYLDAAMDGVEVQVLGRGEWAGMNSAFSSLSKFSRDFCHVVAIDGIWLQKLLEPEPQILHRFTDEELKILIPNLFENERTGKSTLEAANDFYVTHSVTTSHSMAGMCAIPMRHNWGVLAVTKPAAQYVRLGLKTALGIFHQKKQPEFDKKREEARECKDFLRIIRQNQDRQFVPKEKGAEKCLAVLDLLMGYNASGFAKNPIWQTVWGNPAETRLKWSELADFRTQSWSPFWRGGWFERNLHLLAEKRNHENIELDLWVLLFPRIVFFGLAATSQESVVSFLLELLLAEMKWKNLFAENQPPTGKGSMPNALRFNLKDPDGNCSRGFEAALYLLCRLLGPGQRRQLASGCVEAQPDIGSGLAERMLESRHGKNAFSAWPKQIALFSREWITTVKDLMPNYDIRSSIRICHLPQGSQPDSFWQAVGGSARKFAETGYGPTVAGTWYLGILDGGNIDLGAEVMRPLISPHQERQRLLNGSGAPVSRAFYRGRLRTEARKSGNPEFNASVSGLLPYGDVMQEMYGTKSQGRKPKDSVDQAKIHFPFHRTQMDQYLDVSLIMFRMIRNVMNIDFKDESNLASRAPDNEFSKLIGREVENAFNRLRELYEENPKSAC